MAQIKVKRKTGTPNLGVDKLIEGELGIIGSYLAYAPNSGGTASVDIKVVAAANQGNSFIEQNTFKIVSDNYFQILNSSSTMATYGKQDGYLYSIASDSDILNATDRILVTRAYVDARVQGLNIRASVVVATTTSLPASYAMNKLTYNSVDMYPTLDGYVFTSNDLDKRFLIKNQSDTPANGIYTFSRLPDVSVAAQFTRATDANQWSELISAFVFVEKGAFLADTGWVCTVDSGGTLGTTDVTWVQFSGAGAYTAGTGLTSAGNVFSLAQISATTVLGNSGGSNATPSGISMTSLKSMLGLGSMAYVANTGTTTITTLGTITSGTWNGGVIAYSYGGTGFSSYTPGDILYGNGTNALSRLPKGAQGQFLIQGATYPAWSALPVASTTASGVVNTISQSFAGVKTFTSGIYVPSGSFYITDSSSNSLITYVNSLSYYNYANDLSFNLLFPDVSTTDKTISFPDANGTVALVGHAHSNLTFNNGGSGDASGTIYTGTAAKTISYNTLGAAPASHATTATTYGAADATNYGHIRFVAAASTLSGALAYDGTTSTTTGRFNSNTSTNPVGTTRLNYEGYFYATKFYGDGTGLTGLSTTGHTHAYSLVNLNGVPATNSTATFFAPSVSGTANQILLSAGAGATPTWSTSTIGTMAYVANTGTTAITTLGTIGTGVWQGTAIGAQYGGTGITSYAAGDILYASATNALSKLAANTTTIAKYLRSISSGTPTWGQIAYSEISGTPSIPAGFTINASSDVLYATGGTNTTAYNATTARTANRFYRHADMPVTSSTASALKYDGVLYAYQFEGIIDGGVWGA